MFRGVWLMGTLAVTALWIFAISRIPTLDNYYLFSGVSIGGYAARLELDWHFHPEIHEEVRVIGCMPSDGSAEASFTYDQCPDWKVSVSFPFVPPSDRYGFGKPTCYDGPCLLYAELPLGWPVAGAWIVSGMIIYRHIRRRDRHRRGGCARCGYSLIGNVSGICPECGAGIGLA